MTDRTKTGLEVLQVSILLGVLGNVMLRETPWGLNVFLFVTVFSASMIVLTLRRRPELWTRNTLALHGAMIFFGAMFVWRDSIELRIYDAGAILTIMGVLILPNLKIAPRIAGVFHYFVGFVWSGICAAFAPAALLAADIDWKSMPQTGATKHLMAIVRGMVIALPIILIFGGLFVAADAVYQGLVERVFNVPAETVLTHVLLTSVLAWLTAGYFRGALFESLKSEPFAAAAQHPVSSYLSKIDNVKAEETVNPDALPDNATILEHINKEDALNVEATPEPEKKATNWQDFDNSVVPQTFTLGAVETAVVLGLVNLLFLSFVIVQVPYLFGGMDLVQNTPDFKLAEYARRGFGELVAVSAIVLPMLLLSHWLLRRDKPANETVYRVLAGIQILLLFVIMASAAQRLVLLTGNLGYGMTTIRLYPMIFMIWLAIAFVWFGVTVLRGARQHFAWGALSSAIFVLAGVHVINPDEFIARTNIALMRQGREFDAQYNSQLSADAIPALLEGMPEMKLEDRCEVGSSIHYRYRELGQKTDLRSLNYSRKVAFRELRTNDRLLHQTEGCPDYLHNDKNPDATDMD